MPSLEAPPRPFIKTIRQAIRITKDGGDKTELVKTFASSIGNFLAALETALNDMQVKDPWHRQRLKYKATPTEVAIKAGGLRPLREAKLSDIQAINRYNKRTYTRLQQKFIDRAVAALKAGDANGLVRAISRAAKYGVIIDDKALEREILQKTLPQEVRTLLMTRKIQRGGQMGLMELLNEGNR